jgi:FkbM family methyltransferase
MRFFGHRISISVKLRNRERESRFKINDKIQKAILGSNSQYLEDIFVDSMFREKKTGTYVDIGANDPCILSNTKLFYDRGWSGVNVEPDVVMYKKLCQERTRDINLNLGIGKQTDELTFYELQPNTLSTFNQKSAFQCVKKEGAKIVSEVKVKVISLRELFATTVQSKRVDFLSLDAEGYEYDILSSNDWKSYRPIAIIVELNQDKDGRAFHFLKNKGYILVIYNGTNGIFVDGEAPEIKRNCMIE